MHLIPWRNFTIDLQAMFCQKPEYFVIVVEGISQRFCHEQIFASLVFLIFSQENQSPVFVGVSIRRSQLDRKIDVFEGFFEQTKLVFDKATVII